MKLQEQWIPWKPEPLLTMYYYIEAIIEDNHRGLTIIYHEEAKHNHIFKITFKNQVHAFRHANESDRLKTLSNEKYCYDRQLYKKHTMFKVLNSKFLKSVLKNTREPLDTSKFTHFLFGTTEEFLDVIASEEPICESYYQAKES